MKPNREQASQQFVQKTEGWKNGSLATCSGTYPCLEGSCRRSVSVGHACRLPQDWSVVLASKSRDYNGERRLRHTVQSVKQVDWAKESKRLVELIGRY